MAYFLSHAWLVFASLKNFDQKGLKCFIMAEAFRNNIDIVIVWPTNQLDLTDSWSKWPCRVMVSYKISSAWPSEFSLNIHKVLTHLCKLCKIDIYYKLLFLLWILFTHLNSFMGLIEVWEIRFKCTMNVNWTIHLVYLLI